MSAYRIFLLLVVAAWAGWWAWGLAVRRRQWVTGDWVALVLMLGLSLMALSEEPAAVEVVTYESQGRLEDLAPFCCGLISLVMIGAVLALILIVIQQRSGRK